MDTAGCVTQPGVRSFAPTGLACPFPQTLLDGRADVLITHSPRVLPAVFLSSTISSSGLSNVN